MKKAKIFSIKHKILIPVIICALVIIAVSVAVPLSSFTSMKDRFVDMKLYLGSMVIENSNALLLEDAQWVFKSPAANKTNDAALTLPLPDDEFKEIMRNVAILTSGCICIYVHCEKDDSYRLLFYADRDRTDLYCKMDMYFFDKNGVLNVQTLSTEDECIAGCPALDSKTLQRIISDDGFVDTNGPESGNVAWKYYKQYDSNGNLAKILGVGEKTATYTVYYNSFFVTILISAFVAAILFFLIIFIISKTVNRIKKVEGYLDNLSGEDFPDEKLLISSGDEIETMSNVVNQMVAGLKERKQLETELGTAASIQQGMMPEIGSLNLNRDVIDLAAVITPARQVGGDFYDLFMKDKRHLVIVIADVSNKGVPAALFMSMGKTLVRSYIRSEETLGKAVTMANKAICKENKGKMFITLWGGILDLATGNLEFTNAGHLPPLIKNGNGAFGYVKDRHGIPLGLREQSVYSQGSMKLEKGGRIILYTDGVTEAASAENELYGKKRLLDAVSACPCAGAEETLRKINEQIAMFTEGIEQFDDITAIAAVYHGNTSVNEAKVFPAVNNNLNTVLDFMEKLMNGRIYSESISKKILLITEELFVNIASYSYPEGNGSAEIGYFQEGSKVTLVFKDSGKEFNPFAQSDPDLSLPMKERKKGGLGNFLIKHYADETCHEYADGHNINTVVIKDRYGE